MDNVNATTLKENKKIKVKVKYKITIYEDEHKQEINPDHRTNPDNGTRSFLENLEFFKNFTFLHLVFYA